MVQYKRDLPVPNPPHSDNSYWGIGGTVEDVEDFKKFHSDYTPNPITGDQALVRADRKLRGLLIYEDCTVAELKGFIQARRLRMPKGSARKAEFIAVLEAADEQPVFDRFSSLPPELRNRVYAQYVDALPALPTLPHQPPLTLTSSLVRQESLPVYYSRATFAVGICTNAGLPEVRNGTVPRQVWLDGAAHTLLRLTSDDDFKRIQYLNVGFFSDRRDHLGNVKQLLLSVRKVNVAESGFYTLREHLKRFHTQRGYWDRALPWVNLAMWHVARQIQRREGVHKLRKTDFEVFRQSIAAALSQTR